MAADSNPIPATCTAEPPAVEHAIQPAKWFRLVGQTHARLQERSRGFRAALPEYLRLATGLAEVAPEVSNAACGRQNWCGEQRLLGSWPWTNVTRSFDAVRATFRSPGYRLDAFASSVVVAQDGSFDHHLQGSNLHGLYGGLEKLIPNAVVEPYVFWRVASRQKLDRIDGVRWVGNCRPGSTTAWRSRCSVATPRPAW